MALSGKLLRDAEIKGNRLGMADMQVAIRLRRESGHDPAMLLGREIGLHDVTDEIAPRLCRYRFCGHPEFLLGIGEPSAKFALVSQAYFANGQALVMQCSCYTPPPIHPQPAR